ncbi:efflux transporter outer membrane subunit [Pokkaliibacter sp. CJK22405]|uniref:efflux transporter outer membrane subunit n=1 Tax=Pokkaliibacter sp. CJK22405 TaxID=3384615 RepID=UPI0039847F34
MNHAQRRLSQLSGTLLIASPRMTWRTGRIKLSGLTLLGLLLAGCAAGPDFKKPDAPDISNLSRAPYTDTVSADHGKDAVAASAAQKLDPATFLSSTWWTSFDSAELDQLVREALTANPDLAATRATLTQASENVLAARGALFPIVSAGLDAQRQQTSGSDARIYNTVGASVDVSYNLDIAGGNRRALEALQASAEAQRFELEAAYQSLAGNVVNSAITAAAYREQIKATEDILTLQQSLLEILETQFEFGSISQAEVESQRASIAATRASLPPIQKSLALTHNQLAIYLGRFPSELSNTGFSLDNLKLPQALPISVPADIVRQRPDIRSAEATLHQAAAQVGVAAADELPQLTLTGSYGRDGNSFADLFNPGTVVWNLASSLTQRIFSGGIYRHQTKAAEAAFEAAGANYRSVVLSAFQDVADTLDALNFDAQTLKARVAAEQAADRSVTIAEEQYRAGGASYSTLLEAQKTLLSARVNRVEAQAARLADTVALYQALGGGWWNREGATEDQPSTPDADQPADTDTTPTP